MKTLKDILEISQRYLIILENSRPKLECFREFIDGAIIRCEQRIFSVKETMSLIEKYRSMSPVDDVDELIKNNGYDIDEIYNAEYNLMEEYLRILSEYYEMDKEETVNKILFED
jgi:hypothetical protein